MKKMQKNDIITGSIGLVLCTLLLVGFSLPMLGLPALGGIFFPGDGVWEIPMDVQETSTISDASLGADVTVYRDSYGIPHIYGTIEADVMFALGYCQAQDRLFMMEMARRLTRGQMSAIMGDSMLETDRLNLAMLKDHYSVQTYLALVEGAKTDPELEDVLLQLQRFTDGVNYFIDHESILPLEFQLLGIGMDHWSIVDTLSMAKYMAEDLTWDMGDLYNYMVYDEIGLTAFNYFAGHPRPYQEPVTVDYGNYLDNDSYSHMDYNFTQLTELVPQGAQPAPSSLKENIAELSAFLEEFPQEQRRQELGSIIGSNNWVVDGNMTDSGLPMIANDMHLGWNLPGIWYQAHLVISDAENALNLWGFFLPGVPYPLVGQNQYIAWGFTNTNYDVLDWYYYTPINETHYIHDGIATAYEYLNYSIEVMKGNPVDYQIKLTKEGPVFSDFLSDDFSDVDSPYEGQVIACQWLAQSVTWELQAFYRYAHATNRAEYNAGSEKFSTPAQNHVYADIYGNIAIRPTGKVPIRDDTGLSHPGMGNGTFPYNGSAGEGAWIEWVPFENLPESINPDQHYLASANQIVAGPDFLASYSLQSDYSQGYRARRINTLLRSQDHFTIADMQSIQLDCYSTKAGNMTSFLFDSLNNAGDLSTLEQTALEMMEDWNFQMDKTKGAPTVFKLWMEMLKGSIFADEFAAWGMKDYLGYVADAHIEYLLRTGDEPWFDNISTTTVENSSIILRDTFGHAVDELATYFDNADPSTWYWGDLHQNYFAHLTGIGALSMGPYPTNGTSDTVSPSYGSIWRNGELRISTGTGGASERWVCDMGAFDQSVSVVPSGQRGVPGSVHYADQLELFLAGEYHPNYFTIIDPEDFADGIVESIIYFIGGTSA
ncbi:MAG: penicillin acylase family protein [Promethearchaeota archaeon]